MGAPALGTAQLPFLGLSANVNAATGVWNTAMADVIQAERKATPTRMLANVSGRAVKDMALVENKLLRMVGAAGLEPATLSFEG